MKTREEIVEDAITKAQELEFEAEVLEERAKKLYDSIDKREVPERYKDRLEDYDRLIDNNYRLGIALFGINSCIENTGLGGFRSGMVIDTFSKKGIPLARILSDWFKEDHSSAYQYSSENRIIEKMVTRDLTEEEYNKHFEYVKERVRDKAPI